jgi:hypothetical protein
LQSSLGTDEELFGYLIGRGLRTGMAPGYFLFNAAELNLEVAEQTFDAMGRFVSPSGNYPEAAPYVEPARSLSPFYDAKGYQGELWSRYRLWEGAVNLEALLHYLIGFDVDVIDGWMQIAPQLPHDSPWIEAGPLFFGAQAFELRVEQGDGQTRVQLTGSGTPADYGLEEYRLRLTLAGAAPSMVSLDGQALAPDAWETRALDWDAHELSLVLKAEAASFELLVD